MPFGLTKHKHGEHGAMLPEHNPGRQLTILGNPQLHCSSAVKKLVTWRCLWLDGL